MPARAASICPNNFCQLQANSSGWLHCVFSRRGSWPRFDNMVVTLPIISLIPLASALLEIGAFTESSYFTKVFETGFILFSTTDSSVVG